MMSVGIGLLRLAIVLLVIAAIWQQLDRQHMFCLSCRFRCSGGSGTGTGCESFRDFGYGQQGDRKAVESRGLITDSRTFQIQLKLTDYDDKLKPGTYELNTSMTPRRIMKILAGEEKTEEDEES